MHHVILSSRELKSAGHTAFMISVLVFSLQYHINKLSIMSSDNHMNNSEKEVDEVDAALSDLEITLEGGKTSNTLVLNTHTLMSTSTRKQM